MNEIELEKAKVRELISMRIHKVPASINSASVQVVRDWKDLIVKARKALESRKTTLQTLNTIHSQLNGF